MNASLFMSKIVSFSEAKKRRVNPGLYSKPIDWSEKRSEARITSNDRIFVQIVACDDYPRMVGTTMSCVSQNVSQHGLQIKSYEFIPEGCQLDLWIDINSRPGKFFLTSDVRWVKEKSDARHTYLLGVELHDGAATDIDEWQSVVN